MLPASQRRGCWSQLHRGESHAWRDSLKLKHIFKIFACIYLFFFNLCFYLRCILHMQNVIKCECWDSKILSFILQKDIRSYTLSHCFSHFFWSCSWRLLWSMQWLKINLSLCNRGYSVLLCQEIIESFYKVQFVSGSFFLCDVMCHSGFDKVPCIRK